jgi:hypothetical protein
MLEGSEGACARHVRLDRRHQQWSERAVAARRSHPSPGAKRAIGEYLRFDGALTHHYAILRSII